MNVKFSLLLHGYNSSVISWPLLSEWSNHLRFKSAQKWGMYRARGKHWLLCQLLTMWEWAAIKHLVHGKNPWKTPICLTTTINLIIISFHTGLWIQKTWRLILSLQLEKKRWLTIWPRMAETNFGYSSNFN